MNCRISQYMYSYNSKRSNCFNSVGKFQLVANVLKQIPKLLKDNSPKLSKSVSNECFER